MPFHIPLRAISLSMAALLATGCAHVDTGSAPAGAATTLASKHWDLVRWSGGELPQGRPLRLDFDAATARFSSSTGCNRAMGGFEVSRETIRFGDGKSGFATTRMACPPREAATERAYLDRLSKISRYEIRGDQLILLSADGDAMTYQAAHKPSANALRKFIYVSAETKPCTGVGPMPCLQVRERESDPWQLHYDGIVDFEPTPGIEYRLRIIEEPVANPPADASSIRWTLDQVIEQRVVRQ